MTLVAAKLPRHEAESRHGRRVLISTPYAAGAKPFGAVLRPVASGGGGSLTNRSDGMVLRQAERTLEGSRRGPVSDAFGRMAGRGCRGRSLATTSQYSSTRKGEEREIVGAQAPEIDRPFSKGLILAQNERWRRGLGMQVERPARGAAQG